jgi:hypothetical protein
VDCRLPGRIIDERGTSEFMDAVENALGISGEPQWYPCYLNSSEDGLGTILMTQSGEVECTGAPSAGL